MLAYLLIFALSSSLVPSFAPLPSSSPLHLSSFLLLRIRIRWRGARLQIGRGGSTIGRCRAPSPRASPGRASPPWGAAGCPSPWRADGGRPSPPLAAGAPSPGRAAGRPPISTARLHGALPGRTSPLALSAMVPSSSSGPHLRTTASSHRNRNREDNGRAVPRASAPCDGRRGCAPTRRRERVLPCMEIRLTSQVGPPPPSPYTIHHRRTLCTKSSFTPLRSLRQAKSRGSGGRGSGAAEAELWE